MTTSPEIVTANSILSGSEKPDWIDILLAATIASWATVTAAITVTLVANLVPTFRLDMIPVIFAMLAFIAVLVFFVSLFGCVVFGLPALGIAKLFGLYRWWQAAILGALAGVLVTLALPGLGSTASRGDALFGAILFIVA